jgi:hypothetical protein
VGAGAHFLFGRGSLGGCLGVGVNLQHLVHPQDEHVLDSLWQQQQREDSEPCSAIVRLRRNGPQGGDEADYLLFMLNLHPSAHAILITGTECAPCHTHTMRLLPRYTRLDHCPRHERLSAPKPEHNSTRVLDHCPRHERLSAPKPEHRPQFYSRPSDWYFECYDAASSTVTSNSDEWPHFDLCDAEGDYFNLGETNFEKGLGYVMIET